jgi:hypothetical protein
MLIGEDNYFWKVYHPNRRDPGRQENFIQIRSTFLLRRVLAKKIVQHLFEYFSYSLDNNVKIYGSFVRDFISQRREFSNIKIAFDNKKTLKSYIRLLPSLYKELKTLGIRGEGMKEELWSTKCISFVKEDDITKYIYDVDYCGATIRLKLSFTEELVLLNDKLLDFDINGFLMVPNGNFFYYGYIHLYSEFPLTHIKYIFNKGYVPNKDTLPALEIQKLTLQCKEGYFLPDMDYLLLLETPLQAKQQYYKMINDGYRPDPSWRVDSFIV